TAPANRSVRFRNACICIFAFGIMLVGLWPLPGIDSQFNILDQDSEPPELIPHLGRLMAKEFPPNAIIVCNFDEYQSTLPYYAQRRLVTGVKSVDEWRAAVAEAGEIAA